MHCARPPASTSAEQALVSSDSSPEAIGLTLAIVLLIAGNWRRLTDVRASLDGGADASVLPIFNTASLVGFGILVDHALGHLCVAMDAGNVLVAQLLTLASLDDALTDSGTWLSWLRLGDIFERNRRDLALNVDAVEQRS